MNSAALTYSGLHSTYINSKQTIAPPARHWYKAKRLGGSLFLQRSRKEQTILIRFQSGHLRTLGWPFYTMLIRSFPLESPNTSITRIFFNQTHSFFGWPHAEWKRIISGHLPR
ncbi:RNase H domain-containing protein [Trichonephila clavipes]|nr:RNase H domain-containing protein [Trichonephila clavipes]